MTAPNVEYGATREFWLGDLSAGTPTYSFLEDAVGSTKRPAQFGRTVRLGDPIDTGPYSTWSQLTWQGGQLQDVWNDREMYQSGNADTATKTGKVRMWPGIKSISRTDAYNGHRMAFCTGAGIGVDQRFTPLWMGEGDRWPWDPKASSYRLFKLSPQYGLTDKRFHKTVKVFTQPIRDIASMRHESDNYNAIFFTTADGLYIINDLTDAVAKDTNTPFFASPRREHAWQGLCSFNEALYYLYGQVLYKRTSIPPYGILGKHTAIKALKQSSYLNGIVVWNNRIWFGCHYPAGPPSVYVSDGATSTLAFNFPHDFYIQKMCVQAGALYIIGQQIAELTGTSRTQQVWRYDGSSLKKLWQQGESESSFKFEASEITTWNDFVVWGRHAAQNDGTQRAGLVFYDTVNDAIVDGPSLPLHSSAYSGGLHVHGLTVWNDSPTVYFRAMQKFANLPASGPGMVAFMRGAATPRNDLTIGSGTLPQFQTSGDPAARKQEIISSEYHGPDDVATEQKTWLALRARVKLTNTWCSVKFFARKVSLGSTWWSLGEFFDDGSDDWRDVTVPIKDTFGEYLQSQVLQYKIELMNDEANVNSTGMPWVDSVAVQWVPAPKTRRQWTIRVPLSDNQLRLDGTANPLTGGFLGLILESYAFSGKPLLFWEPAVYSSGPPGGAGVEVFVQDFSIQWARLQTGDSEQVGTATITFVENVIA